MIRKRPFVLLLGILMVLSAALMLHYRHRIGFMLDDWAFVIYRAEGNPGDYLDPHNEHISILPVAAYKLFLAIFGMGAATPLHVLSVLVFLLSVVALFFYLRLLAGEPAAVIGCAVILFLGAAWEDLLWAFQLGFFLSMAGGLGGLVMLRREDSAGDRIACLFFCVAMTSSSMGIPFMAGALVQILARRDRRLSRLWVVGIPLAIYALWWLGWGHTASNGMSVENAINSPRHVFEAFRFSVAVMTGTFRLSGDFGLRLTHLLAVALAAVTAFLLWRQRRLPRPLVVALAIALTFWGLTALNVIPGRDYSASRYQYPSAVFLLMILAGAVDGREVGRRWLTALAAVAMLAIVVNVFALRDGYRYILKPLSDKGVAGLTALDIAGQEGRPEILVGMNLDDSANVNSAGYFEAEDRYGSAAWSIDEVESSSEAARDRVDQILIAALPVKGSVLEGRAARQATSGCDTLVASPAFDENVQVPGRRFTVRPRQDVFVMMARFADTADSGATIAGANRTTLIHVPPDTSDVPWRVGFVGAGKVRLCPA